MIRNPMPVIPEEEYGRRWEAVQDLMGRLDLDLILAYADDRATFGPESDQYALTAGRIADVRILEEFTHPDEDYPCSEIKSLAEIIPDITPEAPRRVGIAGSALMPGEVFPGSSKPWMSSGWMWRPPYPGCGPSNPRRSWR